MAGGGKILALVIMFMLGVGALAGLAYGAMSFFGAQGPEDDRRPVLRLAGKALSLGGDGVELLKALGGTSCIAKEESGERWVFRLRPEKEREQEGVCKEKVGDLVVWVKDRRIVAFEPVHGESEIVKDAEAFHRYQRRYGRDPVEVENPLDQVGEMVTE